MKRVMPRNRRHPDGKPKRSQRTPNFDSGIITEPLLAFGGRHEHVDPKTGLALYGPYTLAGRARSALTSIIIGIVGPAAMVADAEQWLRACRDTITNDGSQPFLFPHFPGFNEGPPFQCELVYGEAWRETVAVPTLQRALAEATNFDDRVDRIIDLYIGAIEVLAQRDHRPDIILCCLPQEVVDQCTVRASNGRAKGLKTATPEQRLKQKLRRARARGQLSLFLGEGAGDEFEADAAHQNLRRGIKAEAMQFGIPTQLIWPRSLRLTDGNAPRGERVQDVATRAWNLTTALFHKAGGSPWRLANAEPGVCYVGVSFYRELNESNPRMRTSMAQAFTAAGDGYVLRGAPFEWDTTRQNRSPHLDQQSAAALIRSVLDLYKRQNRGSLPARLVIHKTSRFWDEELAGFESACEYIPRKDFVALGERGIQFYRTGDYPPIRGTYVKFSDDNLLLYSSGYVPYLRTYPGQRVPRPIEVVEHYGDTPWDALLKELLALTKMNWNTADFSMSMPVTVAFSRRVGEVLAELPADLPLRPEYRFYM